MFTMYSNTVIAQLYLFYFLLLAFCLFSCHCLFIWIYDVSDESSVMSVMGAPDAAIVYYSIMFELVDCTTVVGQECFIFLFCW